MAGLNSPEFLIAYDLSKTLSKRNKAYLRSIEDYTKMERGCCFASQERIGGRLSQYGYRQDIGLRQSHEAFRALVKLKLIDADRPHKRATYRTVLTEIGKLTAMIIQDNCPKDIMEKRLGLESKPTETYGSSVSRHMERFAPKLEPKEATHISQFVNIPPIKNHELVEIIKEESACQIDENPRIKVSKSAYPNLNILNTHINKQQHLTRARDERGLGLARDVVCFKTGLHKSYYDKIEHAGLLEHLSLDGRSRLSDAVLVKIEKGQTITDPVAWARGVCRKLLEEQKLEQQLKSDQRRIAESSITATTKETSELFDIDTGTLEERKAIIARNKVRWQSLGLRVGEHRNVQ